MKLFSNCSPMNRKHTHVRESGPAKTCPMNPLPKYASFLRVSSTGDRVSCVMYARAVIGVNAVVVTLPFFGETTHKLCKLSKQYP